jgi:DNA transformation protein
MSISCEFVEYVLDQLAAWGGVSASKMFGCAGLYRDGMMFGLIADDVAYLKVDGSNREDFEKAGSSPFAFYPYPDKTREAVMSYYEIPADVLENPDELARWAERSLAVAKERK